MTKQQQSVLSHFVGGILKWSHQTPAGSKRSYEIGFHHLCILGADLRGRECVQGEAAASGPAGLSVRGIPGEGVG